MNLANLLLKVLVTVGMTHGFRWLGSRFGPRWGGMLLALPCFTAVVLLFLGLEQGAEFAGTAAQLGLFGLMGAVVFSMTFAIVQRYCSRLELVLAAALAAYLLAGTTAMWTVPKQFLPILVSCTIVVIGTSVVTSFLPTAESPVAKTGGSPVRSLVLRSVIPAVAIVVITHLAGCVDHSLVGLLSSFPATFFSVLIVTHLEESPQAAQEMARCFPKGNLSMIGFLTVFGLAAPALGLFGAMALAYPAALAGLVAGHLIQRIEFTQFLKWSRNMSETMWDTMIEALVQIVFLGWLVFFAGRKTDEKVRHGGSPGVHNSGSENDIALRPNLGNRVISSQPELVRP